jgi:hypothetical protein
VEADRDEPNLIVAEGDKSKVESTKKYFSTIAEPRERISIESRITMRRNIKFARGVPRNKMVAVTADELEALLDAYEHGGFRTNE